MLCIRSMECKPLKSEGVKIALNAKRRPWLDGIFAKIEDISPPFQYFNA